MTGRVAVEAARGTVAADDETVFVVGEVLERRFARRTRTSPLLKVGGVREVAYLAARTAEAAVKPLVRPAVAVEPLDDSVACSMS